MKTRYLRPVLCVIAAGVHGVYTTDTASEFYTLEIEEWNELATHFRAVARDCGLPAGVGCTWTNQAGALRRIARARDAGYANIHLSPRGAERGERDRALPRLGTERSDRSAR